MFNIGFAELILVLLVAFLIVGPKDLPKVARWIARQVKKCRSLLRELKTETGWDELTRDIEDTKREVTEVVKEADVTAELQSASRDVEQSLNSVKDDIHRLDEEAKEAIKE